MRNKFDKSLYARSSALRFFASAVVLVLFLCAIFAPSTASAVCPDGYVSQIKDKNLDWQTSKDNLNLDYVKSAVAEWMSSKDYNFSELEKNPLAIAVIDTGINFSHEVFTGKYDENGVKTDSQGIGKYDVLYRDKDGHVISKNTDDSSKDASDASPNRHGTHVAGVIATLIHELNLEKYVKIMPIKASKGSKNDFESDSLREAIDFALKNGADVVNMSISDKGVTPGETTEYDLVSNEDAQKAVFVAAAGNNSQSTADKFLSKGRRYFPAASKNVVGVMNYESSNGKKSLAASSNYGSAYDICAPGVSIWSADGTSNEAYKSMNGTSMATPVISFACALAMLKDRAFCNVGQSQTKSYSEIAQSVKNAYSQTIKKDNFDLGIFSFEQLLSGEVKVRIVVDGERGELTQYINSVRPIALRLEVLPHVYDKSGEMQWFVDDQPVQNDSADAFEFVYTPQNVVSKTNIVAKWTNAELNVQLTASCDVKVDYYEFSEKETGHIVINTKQNDKISDFDSVTNSIAIDERGVVEFYLPDEIFENLAPSTYVKWYVDDKFYATGKSFAFDFKNVGEYKVKAKIDNYYTSETTVIVKKANEEESKVAEYVTLAISCALFAGLIAVAATILVRKKKALK